MLKSITRAAQDLGVSPDHCRRMIRAGRWPSYKLGPKAIRLDPEEIKGLWKLIAEGERERRAR